MKDRLSWASRIIVCGAIILAAGSSQAQTTAPGPYYATPSWDQKLRCDTQATCPRFIVLSNWNNDAVLDRETGLVWEKSPNHRYDWLGALDFCPTLTTGNRRGWRLPALQELESLVDLSVTSPPALPPGHPFILPPSFVESVNGSLVWIDTTMAREPSDAWVVAFFNTNIGASFKVDNNYVWCVRGGKGSDAQ